MFIASSRTSAWRPEATADEADRSLDATLLVASSDVASADGEAAGTCVVEEPRVEDDGGRGVRRHDRLHVVEDLGDAKLKKRPLQQVWRDHLLAGSLLLDRGGGYTDGFFAFLHPRDNERCVRAVEADGVCLSDATSFVPWTIEVLVEALRAEGGGPWVDAFARRYLGFDAIERLLREG
jgi:hypothetical protein